MNEKNEFATRDLDLASALVTLDFEIVNMDIQHEGERNRPIGYFSFSKTEELEKAEEDFHNKKLRVEPSSLSNNMRRLKARVIDANRAPCLP